MPASFAWRLTLASRRFTPKAPVRLRKPASEQIEQLQHNRARRAHRLKRIPHGARRIATAQMKQKAARILFHAAEGGERAKRAIKT